MSNTVPIYVAVVDDDENVCQSFGRLLRASGIQPVTYPSAEDFLADSKQPRFDCLVLDIHMGGMSGIDLSHQLRSEGSEIPIIVITALDDPERRAEVQSLSGTAFFLKSDSGAQLLDAIHRMTA